MVAHCLERSLNNLENQWAETIIRVYFSGLF